MRFSSDGSISCDKLINSKNSKWSLAGIDTAVRLGFLELFRKAGKNHVRVK